MEGKLSCMAETTLMALIDKHSHSVPPPFQRPHLAPLEPVIARRLKCRLAAIKAACKRFRPDRLRTDEKQEVDYCQPLESTQPDIAKYGGGGKHNKQVKGSAVTDTI